MKNTQRVVHLPVLAMDVVIAVDAPPFLGLEKPWRQKWRDWQLDERKHEMMYLQKLSESGQYYGQQ